MARQATIRINAERFRSALKKRGVLISEAEREIGHTSGYFTKACKDGFFTQATVNHLRLAYNLDLSEYGEFDESEEIATEDEKPVKTIEVRVDFDMLKEIIYDAVHSAVKDAFQ